MKKIAILITALLITLCGCSRDTGKVEVKINDKSYKFEVASTKEERAKGLMYRKKLDKKGGMLFVFTEMRVLSFYMKNTLIPLDIAFIDNNFEIIDIQTMEPLDETSVNSKGRAQYALEVNKGFFEAEGIKVGDRLELLKPLIYSFE